jgi:Beta-galactosidase
LRQRGEWTLWALLIISPAGAQSLPVDLRGIYVGGNNIVNENAKSLTAALTAPGVDGLLLNIGWDQIEPALGQYEWTTLDQWMSQAIAAGKKITVSVGDGARTPSWLFQPAPAGAGATPLSFSISRKGGLSNVCDPETIAAPWDPAFLNQWDSMVAALAAHLKSAGTYNAVKLLRLTGINRDTDELHLPEETAKSTGLACVSDAIATWQQAGYRPSLLLRGWDAITTSFQKNFPEKYFSVAIIARTDTPFPPIAEDGSLITGAIPDLSGPPSTNVPCSSLRNLSWSHEGSPPVRQWIGRQSVYLCSDSIGQRTTRTKRRRYRTWRNAVWRARSEAMQGEAERRRTGACPWRITD